MGIYKIVKDSIASQNETLEFDLKELPHEKCRELETYVTNCIRENNSQKQPVV
jgi:hypothetical protein